MALTEQLIRNTYKKLKEKANSYISKENIRKGELYTHLAAYTNYTFWLSYYDEEIEQLLKKMSTVIRQIKEMSVVTGHCVMFDSISRYRGGLSVQYVTAILSAGWDLLYITEQELSAPHHIELYNFLKSYKNIRIVEIPRKMKGKRRLQYIYNLVVAYGAERVFVHSSSSNVLFPTVCYALPANIEKFYIDMADHGFRMGMSACDYVFQFRSLGCSIAIKKRNIPKNKLLYLPFYPIIDEKQFKGLPEICKGKVIVISGGIFWKIIDKEDTFFKLAKLILKHNTNAIIVYPGGGNKTYIQSKLKEYGIDDRFLLLGWRDDISELFRHADLYLNTFPHGGGTMSLYAAHLHKPILSYIPDECSHNPIEKIVCQKETYKISSVGMDEFLEEASLLINNEVYRKSKANQTWNCIISIDSFNSMFKELSVNHTNKIPFSINDNLSDTIGFTTKNIEYHNRQGEYQLRLVAHAGLNMITCRKEYLFPFILKIYPKLKQVISERGIHFNRI